MHDKVASGNKPCQKIGLSIYTQYAYTKYRTIQVSRPPTKPIVGKREKWEMSDFEHQLMAAKSHNITQLVQFLHNAQPQPQTQEEQEHDPQQKRRNIQKSGSRRVNTCQELFAPSVAHMRSHTTLSSAPLITHSAYHEHQPIIAAHALSSSPCSELLLLCLLSALYADWSSPRAWPARERAQV